MAQVVGHVRKIKTSVGVHNVINHNKREEVYDKNNEPIKNPQSRGEYFNPDNAIFNVIDDIENPYAEREKLLKEAKKENLEHGEDLRKPQKNASAGVEYVLSFSHDWCSDWEKNPESKAKIDEFMTLQKDLMVKKHGGTILHMAEHWDEKTPHLHVVCVPLTKNIRVQNKDQTGKSKSHIEKGTLWRYSSGDFLGGRSGMTKFQQELFENVKHLGLNRGIEGKRSKHENLKRYGAELENLKHDKKAFDAKVIELNNLEKDLFKRDEVLLKKENLYSEKKGVLETLEKKILDREKKVNDREKMKDLYVEGTKTSLYEFKFPEPFKLESANKYKLRVEPKVLGVVKRALNTLDKVDSDIRNIENLRKEEKQKSDHKAYQDKTSLKIAEENVNKYKESFETLSKLVLEIEKFDDVKPLQESIQKYKKEQKSSIKTLT